MTRALLVGAGTLVLLFASAALAAPAPAAFIECDVVGVCLGTDDADFIIGTDGFDEIRGGQGPDLIRALGSGDNVYGGLGDDTLTPGGGDDAVFGRGGNDEIHLASDDSGGDFADCGDGNDEVWADPADAVSPDCETVHID